MIETVSIALSIDQARIDFVRNDLNQNAMKITWLESAALLIRTWTSTFFIIWSHIVRKAQRDTLNSSLCATERVARHASCARSIHSSLLGPALRRLNIGGIIHMPKPLRWFSPHPLRLHPCFPCFLICPGHLIISRSLFLHHHFHWVRVRYSIFMTNKISWIFRKAPKIGHNV